MLLDASTLGKVDFHKSFHPHWILTSDWSWTGDLRRSAVLSDIYPSGRLCRKVGKARFCFVFILRQYVTLIPKIYSFVSHALTGFRFHRHSKCGCNSCTAVMCHSRNLYNLEAHCIVPYEAISFVRLRISDCVTSCFQVGAKNLCIYRVRLLMVTCTTPYFPDPLFFAYLQRSETNKQTATVRRPHVQDFDATSWGMFLLNVGISTCGRIEFLFPTLQVVSRRNGTRFICTIFLNPKYCNFIPLSITALPSGIPVKVF